jgi:hypothetical protein
MILIINNMENLPQNFIDDYNNLIQSAPKKKKKNPCREICTFFNEFFFPYANKEVLVDLNISTLTPYDTLNYNNHVCIIIPGYISQGHNNHNQWENFIIDYDIYVDFYFYVWESKSGMKVVKDILRFLGGLSLTLLTRNFLKVFNAYKTYQHKNNLFARTIEISKYFGKLLAYLIASKAFFQHRVITLVGYSLGGHVLKHCLKELTLIAEYLPYVKDLIHHVVFIGAATTFDDSKGKWNNLKKFISGRIINCYCPKDEVLLGIFNYITSKDAIGVKPMKILGLEEKIENYDFGDSNIKHEAYKQHLNDIMKKIDLF